LTLNNIEGGLDECFEDNFNLLKLT